MLYIEHIKKELKPSTIEDVINEINKFINKQAYVIMITGPPRTGKTSLAYNIIKYWRNSSIGKNNQIFRLGLDKNGQKNRLNKYKKYIKNKVSIVLDDGCHTQKLRLSYLKTAFENNTAVLFIEVNCGLQMAKVFNHVHVEESNRDDVYLHKLEDYYAYRSQYEEPAINNNLHTMIYTPIIDERPAVIKLRY